MRLHRHNSVRSAATRGILVTEMLFGLFIVGTLLGLFIATTLKQDRNLRTFAEKRTASRLAESTLVTLQSAPASAGGQVRIRRLTTPSPVPGRIWVEVTATSAGQSASLVGLVPASNVTEKEAPLETPK